MKLRNIFQTLYSLLLILVKGLVLWHLWIWFIIPFFNVDPLSYPIAVGIVTMFALMNHLPIWHFDNPDDEFRYNITIGLKPFILLFFGYIIHLFI